MCFKQVFTKFSPFLYLKIDWYHFHKIWKLKLSKQV